MPDVDAIIQRLRTGSWAGPDDIDDAHVRLSDAEAAVLAAVDARTAEIVTMLRGEADAGGRWVSGAFYTQAADEVARRFPSSGDTTREDRP